MQAETAVKVNRMHVDTHT